MVKKLELRVSFGLSSSTSTEGFSLLKLLNFVAAPFSSRKISHWRLHRNSFKAGICYQKKPHCIQLTHRGLRTSEGLFSVLKSSFKDKLRSKMWGKKNKINKLVCRNELTHYILRWYSLTWGKWIMTLY